MVGAALACALGDSALRIAVVEPRPPAMEWPPETTDLRVSAITCASQRLFTALHAWEAMQAERVSPFREMRVWDAGGNGEVHFDSADIGAETLGYIIENRVIQRALIQRLQDRDNITLHCPAAVSQLQHEDHGIVLMLDNGRHISADLIIGADGAQSRVRKLAGIDVLRRDYQQSAVVTTVTTRHHHQETAWQRFLATGPLAFLPLWDGRSSIVWSTTAQHARHLCALEEDAFNHELQEAFEQRLGDIEHSGQRASFVLQRQHASTYVRPRIALIGDAAHTVHPLAGQGVNLGLLDAAALAEVLLEAVAAGRDIGGLAVLRRYERWRKGDNLLMMTALDGFKQLFGTSAPPLALARNLGMNMLNGLAPAKQHIMRYAMGYRDDMPRLVH